MGLGEVIRIIEDPNMAFQAERDTVLPPWDIAPNEYLEFAKEDIEGNDRRSAVNALSNAKRALECQVDSILFAFELGGTSARWRMPRKIEVLRQIGVVAPRILAKINAHRNEMEHEYSRPALEVVEDFVDVVALFIESTKVHIVDRRCAWEFDLGDGQGAHVELRNGNLWVNLSGGSDEPFKVSAGSEDFLCLLGTIGLQTAWETSLIQKPQQSPAPLPQPQRKILWLLSELHPESVTLTGFANALETRKAIAEHHLSELHGQGLIEVIASSDGFTKQPGFPENHGYALSASGRHYLAADSLDLTEFDAE